MQLKAQREHQIKLQSLKLKLRKLRARLKTLQSDYGSPAADEDQQETEKSEMETLKDLKTATEEAIVELQHEATKAVKKASKRKGEEQIIQEPGAILLDLSPGTQGLSLLYKPRSRVRLSRIFIQLSPSTFPQSLSM